MFSLILIVLVELIISINGQKFPIPEEEKRSMFWEKSGQKNLYASLRLQKNENIAKNLILFLGDGMGMTTVTSTRIYKGQKRNKNGEEELLSFDEFPHVSLSKTYGVDRQTSDSANTATAYLCGVKANYGTLGVDGRVQFENCESSIDPSTHVNSILQWAQEKGKWTGLVTTTRVTHATPAGTYAHSASRNWESSTPNPACTDIAYQLIHHSPGKNMHVIMGGGRRHFFPDNQKDRDGEPGARNDSRNLLDDWNFLMKSNKYRSSLIFDYSELKKLKVDEVDYVLGLFHSDHLPYVTERPSLNKSYPTLTDMTETAIKILSKSPEGFVLLVEGGKIDVAHHNNWAMKALEEGVEFDHTIATAQVMTNEKDTLMVVTADHSHTFTVGGDYPLRGNSILGLGGVSDVDNKTFTSLGYQNGPGYRRYSRDRNLTEEETTKSEFRQDVTLPMLYETHGAEDVPVYAKGPWAHLFHGVHDQSYIPYAMGYAACIGPNQEACNGAISTLASQGTALKFIIIALSTYLRGRTMF